MIIEQDLIDAVREQARQHPDRVYHTDREACTYAPNPENPCFGCIVGEALRSLGVPAELIQQISEWGSWANMARDEDFTAVLGHLISDGARRSVWVANVQSHQDSGLSWSRAVEKADAEALA